MGKRWRIPPPEKRKKTQTTIKYHTALFWIHEMLGETGECESNCDCKFCQALDFLYEQADDCRAAGIKI